MLIKRRQKTMCLYPEYFSWDDICLCLLPLLLLLNIWNTCEIIFAIVFYIALVVFYCNTDRAKYCGSLDIGHLTNLQNLF